jgi:hypothetical protein
VAAVLAVLRVEEDKTALYRLSKLVPRIGIQLDQTTHRRRARTEASFVVQEADVVRQIVLALKLDPHAPLREEELDHREALDFHLFADVLFFRAVNAVEEDFREHCGRLRESVRRVRAFVARFRVEFRYDGAAAGQNPSDVRQGDVDKLGSGKEEQQEDAYLFSRPYNI